MKLLKVKTTKKKDADSKTVVSASLKELQEIQKTLFDARKKFKQTIEKVTPALVFDDNLSLANAEGEELKRLLRGTVSDVGLEVSLLDREFNKARNFLK